MPQHPRRPHPVTAAGSRSAPWRARSPAIWIVPWRWSDACSAPCGR